MIAKNKKKQKESSLSAIFFSIVLLGVMFAMVGFLVVSNWKISNKRADLRIRINELQQEIQNLITGDFSHVKLFQAHKHQKKYELEFTEIN